MKINDVQLEQVNSRIQALVKAGSFYGKKLEEAGITGVNSAEDFEKLAQQEQVPLNLKPRGKKILDTESLTVTLNKAQHQMVIVQTITLVEGIDLDDIVWNNAYEIRKCFTGNKKSIQTAIQSQGRTSTRS